jgi:hypothetical protein
MLFMVEVEKLLYMKSGKVAVLALIGTVHQQSPCKTNTQQNRLRLILGLEAKILQ